MEKPRVLLVHDFPCQTGGGGEVNLSNIAQATASTLSLVLASRGARETGLSEKYEQYIELDGGLSDLGKVRNSMDGAVGTVFTANSYHSAAMMVGLALSHRRVNLLWQSSPVSQRRGLRRIAGNTKGRTFAMLASNNLTFSPVGLQQLQRMGVPPNRLTLLPQILHEDFSLNMRNPCLRSEVIGDDIDLAVLINARVSAHKGLADWTPTMMEYLIPELENTNRTLQIGLVGNDPKTPESLSILDRLQQLGSRTPNLRFVYHGYDPHKMPARLMQAYDILVHPSPQEGHSVAAVEGLSCGLPLLVRKVCLSNVGIVESSKAGYVVESPQDAAMQLSSLSRDLSPLEGLRLCGYDYINHHTGFGPFRDAFIPAVLGHK